MSLFFSGCLFGGKSYKETVGRELLHPQFQDFEQKVSSHQGDLNQYEFSHGTEFVLINSMAKPAGQALVLASELAATIEASYEPQTVPYPGMISKDIKCDPQYLPKQTRSEGMEWDVRVFDLYANERKVYGACLTSQVKFRSYYALVVCKKSGRFYEVKYFFDPKANPAKTLEEFANAFACG